MDKRSLTLSYTISSLLFPPPEDDSLGLVSNIVSIISLDSFNLKVKSAFPCNPNTSGLSLGGTVAT